MQFLQKIFGFFMENSESFVNLLDIMLQMCYNRHGRKKVSESHASFFAGETVDSFFGSYVIRNVSVAVRRIRFSGIAGLVF